MLDRYHESLLPEFPPTPDQLHRLASIGAGSASMRHRLKRLPRRSERAHYFIEELDLLPVSEYDDEEIRNMRHRMAGRIGVRMANPEGGPKIWSLKFSDTTWVEQSPNIWLAQRSLYKFEWMRTRALMSERSTIVIGDGTKPQEDLYDAIDAFNITDNELAMWHAQSEFETITAEDIELLIQDASEYFSMVESITGRAA